MVRVDHYSQFDDPNDYFRRLESYSSSRLSSFSRPNSYADSLARSSSPIRRRSDQDSGSVPAPGSRSIPHPDSRFEVHSRPDSCATLQTRSYADSDSLYYVSEKPSRRQQPKSYSQYTPASNPKSWWTRRRKLIIWLSIIFLLIIIIIAVVVARIRATSFDYTPSYAHVTNQKAFTSGGATHNSPNDIADGIGRGQDRYTYYSGGPRNFPQSSTWVSFGDMWQVNTQSIQNACSVLGYGSDNTASQTQDIYNAIQDRANASLVDHRFILAVILQESHGCVHIGSTTSSSGVSNPGLMQSHNGDSFSSAHASQSILAMVQDGTQGTKGGAGLVQNLNIYGDPYSAARGYNSGYIAKDGDLSDAAGATACYVSDIANRLTGWVNAKSTCPGDDEG